MELAAAYDPDVVAVQLNLVGSHDAPRLRTVLGDDVTGVRLATLLQMTLPGAPCIYYGDEIGLRGGNDPENRGAFPWDEGRWDTGLRDSVRAMTPPPGDRAGPARQPAAGRRRGRIRRGLRARRRRGTLRRRGQRGRFARSTSGSGSAMRRRAPEGTSPSVELAGFAPIGETPIVDGRATIGLAPRSGGVLRVV